MCLLHFWLQMSDFLMGLLHFCFLFFIGCPDGLQERFSTILVALWEALVPSWAVLGCLLGLLGVLVAAILGLLEATKEHFGSHF